MTTRTLVPLATLLIILAASAACETQSQGGGDSTPLDTASVDVTVADTAVHDTSSPDTSDASDAPGGLCPATAPIGMEGCSASAHCEYGEECCCGECHPSLVCDCQGGQWGCYNTDACMITGCPDVVDSADAAPDVEDASSADAEDSSTPDAGGICPATAPIGVEGCDGSAHCEYGEECCCGECHPSLVCDCQGGTWSCHNTDACMISGCSCRGDSDCDDAQACTAPDDPQACGMCQEPESTCLADVDCAELPGTVCDVPTSGCYCNNDPTCVPACTDDQACKEGETCTEGHCVATTCVTDTDCPAFFSCIQDASGQCARTACTTDALCGDGGFCVNGHCYDQRGLCEYPVP